jgi:hypothetical protein
MLPVGPMQRRKKLCSIDLYQAAFLLIAVKLRIDRILKINFNILCGTLFLEAT